MNSCKDCAHEHSAGYKKPCLGCDKFHSGFVPALEAAQIEAGTAAIRDFFKEPGEWAHGARLGDGGTGITEEIEMELARADVKHGDMPSVLRGFYTLKCEFTELEAEILGGSDDMAAARVECVQLAAMCHKLIRRIDRC